MHNPKPPWLISAPKARVIFLNWPKLFYCLRKLQKRIGEATIYRSRQRNLQRLLRRSRSVQLLVIFHILQKNYRFNEQLFPSHWSHSQPNYFNQLQTPPPFHGLYFEGSNLSFSPTQIFYTQNEVVKTKNPFFAFIHDLWVLCLLPVVENRSHRCNFVRPGQESKRVFFTICEYIRAPQYSWVTTLKIFIPLNQRNKIQLLKNFYSEKKFLAAWFIARKSWPLPDRVSARYGESICVQSLIDAWLSNQILEYLDALGYFNTLFYAHILFIFTTRPVFYRYNHREIKKWLQSNLISPGGLSVNAQIHKSKTTSIKTGFDFLGWRFSRRRGRAITTISQSNVRAHCRELNQLLKSSGPKADDKTLVELNKKIHRWKNYYSCAHNLSETWSFLNQWLFWRLWRWVKKRHHHQGSKWLYARYWTIERINHPHGAWFWCFQTHEVRALRYGKKSEINRSRPNTLKY
uniref:Group II intron maturase-specific domain-containing protein n=1 Tax=Pseudobryopsis hainanensis TaxID=2320808 RepID=A0A3S5WZN1_9CHLO|nr:hypothetical protein [Pseudobryopsis hainanensis]